MWVSLGNTCTGQPCNPLPRVRSRHLQVKNKTSIPQIWTEQDIKWTVYYHGFSKWLCRLIDPRSLLGKRARQGLEFIFVFHVASFLMGLFRGNVKEHQNSHCKINIALLDIQAGMGQTGWSVRSLVEHQGGLPPPRHQNVVRTRLELAPSGLRSSALTIRSRWLLPSFC